MKNKVIIAVVSIISILLVLYFAFSETDTDYPRLLNIDEYVWLNSKNKEVNFDNIELDTLSTKPILFHFYNNPFGLTDKDSLIIVINYNCVYKGKFRVKGYLYFKLNEFIEGESIHIGLGIKKSGIYYEFDNIWQFYLNSNVREFQICFMPNNEPQQNYYVFQSNEETFWLSSKKITIDGSDSTNLNK